MKSVLSWIWNELKWAVIIMLVLVPFGLISSCFSYEVREDTERALISEFEELEDSCYRKYDYPVEESFYILYNRYDYDEETVDRAIECIEAFYNGTYGIINHSSSLDPVD